MRGVAFLILTNFVTTFELICPAGDRIEIPDETLSVRLMYKVVYKPKFRLTVWSYTSAISILFVLEQSRTIGLTTRNVSHKLLYAQLGVHYNEVHNNEVSVRNHATNDLVIVDPSLYYWLYRIMCVWISSCASSSPHTVPATARPSNCVLSWIVTFSMSVVFTTHVTQSIAIQKKSVMIKCDKIYM